MHCILLFALSSHVCWAHGICEVWTLQVPVRYRPLRASHFARVRASWTRHVKHRNVILVEVSPPRTKWRLRWFSCRRLRIGHPRRVGNHRHQVARLQTPGSRRNKWDSPTLPLVAHPRSVVLRGPGGVGTRPERKSANVKLVRHGYKTKSNNITP